LTLQAGAVALFACFAGAAQAAEGDTRWFVTGFGGFSLSHSYTETLSSPWNSESTGEGIGALTLSYEIGRVFDRRLAFEIEGLYAYHFGDQHYHEVGAAIYARWHEFPWNDHLKTSFALGIGPSYTTTLSAIEAADGHTAKLLNQANLELTFALPEYERDMLLLRFQHRSGVFGTIDDVWDGSTFLVVGYKRAF
jgi:hypothetical protein